MKIKNTESIGTIPRSEWMSVQELQPEKNKRVLMFVDEYYIDLGDRSVAIPDCFIMTGSLTEAGWVLLPDCDCAGPAPELCVTHWMDLPSSPYEEHTAFEVGQRA